MMNRSIAAALLITSLCLSAGCAMSSSADDHVPRSAPAVQPSEALKTASDLYKERTEIEKVRKAIEELEKARDPDNRNFEVEAAYAKYSYFLGSRKEIDADEAEKVLKKGMVAAKIASRLEPSKPDGHFWTAAILGEQSKRAPMTVGIVSIDKIRRGMNKTVEIDPKFQGASGYLGLGQLELNTRGLAGGDVKKAIDYLEKGMKADPKNAYFYVYLAEAYFDVEKSAKANELIAKLNEMEPDPDYLPEYKHAQEIAKELLDKNRA